MVGVIILLLLLLIIIISTSKGGGRGLVNIHRLSRTQERNVRNKMRMAEQADEIGLTWYTS
jgi:hypothetical protein